MKEPSVIISILHLTTATGTLDIRDYTTQTHPHAAAAKKAVLDLLEENRTRINKETGKDTSGPGLPVITEEGSTANLFQCAEGVIVYSIGCEKFVVTFKKEPGEYNVSDDEVFSALDAYVNSGRNNSNYKAMAERISANMHRYCQSELWRFVKQLIRAFATGRFDDRNRTAHRQAKDIAEFMEANNI